MRLALMSLAKASRLAGKVLARWAILRMRKAIRATAIWVLMAFSLVPRKRLILRCCLTQRKNSSICQRAL